MPSCVVKSCKNYLNKLNKSHGVTYHAFPRNKQRRDEWISIIRNCRKQSNWEPSYASTVCSAHFNDDDFIETATGLRCLIPFAIPSKLLSEPSETQATAPQVTPDVKKEYQDDEQPSSSTSAMPAVLQAPILRFALTRYCRLCASTNCDVMSVDVQSDSGLKNIVMNMLTRLNTNIDFNQEHFPTTICSACVKSLYTAYDFVVGIDMAQTTLNKILMQKYKYQMAENLDNDMDLSNPTLQQVSPKLETIEIETDFSSTPLMQVSPKIETEECESDLSRGSMVSPKIEAIENESELSSTSSQPEAEETQVSPKIEAAESDVEFATDFDQPCINESSMTTLQQPSLNTGTGTSNFKPVNFKSGDGNQSLDYYILKLEFEDALLKKQKTTERLRKTIKKLRERVRYLQKINDRKFENPFSQNAIATCLYDNFKRKLRKKNQNRYSGEFKKFCAILNDYSPTAYEYVRLSFDGCLPPSKIVERMWRDHIRRGMAKGVEENAASTSEEQEQKESV